MKKCPFCKADIEDHARFCLYCMKPLNHKEVILPPQRKKQWWLLAVGILLAALLAVVILLPRGQNDLTAQSTGEETSSASTQTTGVETTESSDTTVQTIPKEDAAQEDADQQTPVQPSGTTNTNQTPDVSPTEPENGGAQPEPSESTVPVPSIQPETQPQTTTPSTAPQETTGESVVPETVVYSYRAARAGDDFSANYTNAGNDIVITGIVQQSADGIYDIPSYIDGKKVVAIVANAFSGSNAKVVYIPTTVKTVWNYAFTGCGLTDIYFRGNAIYVESKAFDGSLTIHCSAACTDRAFRYYKDCAVSYGAAWEEWNG